MQQGYIFPKYDVFELSTSPRYGVTITLVANSGYTFADEVSILVNGGAIQIKSSSVKDGLALKIYSIDLPALYAIDTVEISDIKLPQAGKKPDYTVTLPTDAPYHLASAEELVTYGYGAGVIANAVNGVYWYDSLGKKYLSPNAGFEFGNSPRYRISFVLILNSGYLFADTNEISVSLNGGSIKTAFKKVYGQDISIDSFDLTFAYNDWVRFGGKWYHFDANGVMQTGWQKIGNSWYYFKSGGNMTTGWTKVGKSWYYLKSSGEMQTGWYKEGNYWYYLKSDGAMVTGTQVIGGKTYKFDSYGRWIA